SASLIFQIQTGSLPEKNSMLVNIVYQVATTLAAILAIGCTKILPALYAATGLPSGHPYMPIFLFWSVLSLIVIFVAALCLRSDGEGGLLEDLSTLAPSNLFSIFRLHMNEEKKRPVFLNQHITEGIMMQPTQASRALLTEWMSSADLMQRLSALRTLNHTRTPELFEAVYDEVKSVDSPLRSEAISTLGFMGNHGAVELLHDCLDDPSVKIQAAALKSLFRLGESLPAETVLHHYSICTDNRMRLEILAGLTAGQERELLYRILGEELAKQPDPLWTQTLFAYTAEVDGKRETLLEMLNEEHRQHGEGLTYLLAEIETSLPEDVNPDALRCLFASDHYEELAARLKRHLDLGWLTLYDRTTALGGLFLWALHWRQAEGEKRV
ncbi:MAG: HEAT repeat domain-containing protein, partial [Planctomycetota bacterium]